MLSFPCFYLIYSSFFILFLSILGYFDTFLLVEFIRIKKTVSQFINIFIDLHDQQIQFLFTILELKHFFSYSYYLLLYSLHI